MQIHTIGIPDHQFDNIYEQFIEISSKYKYLPGLELGI